MEFYTRNRLIKELLETGTIIRVADPDSKKGEYKYLYSIVKSKAED